MEAAVRCQTQEGKCTNRGVDLIADKHPDNDGMQPGSRNFRGRGGEKGQNNLGSMGQPYYLNTYYVLCTSNTASHVFLSTMCTTGNTSFFPMRPLKLSMKK